MTAGHPVEPRQQRGRRSPGHYHTGYQHGAKRGKEIDTSPRRSQLGGGGKPPSKKGCPLTLLMLPLLPLYLALAWWNRRDKAAPPEWPPPHSRRNTPPPRRDLSDAAEHYAREARKARKRADGFQLGDSVRRRNHHNPPKE